MLPKKEINYGTRLKTCRNSIKNRLTLSVSTSDMISLIVASSPIPYSFMAVSSSSLVINLPWNQTKTRVDVSILMKIQ